MISRLHLLATVLLVAGCLLQPALSAVLAPSCLVSTTSCDAHQECIEPLMPCGATGFTLGYAQRRCQAVQQLSHNPAISWLPEWLLAQEECVQRRLLQLATNHSTANPDPPSCLAFELVALATVEECIIDTIGRLCSSNELATDPQFLTRQLVNVTRHLMVHDYYRHKVAMAIRRAVSDSCSHQNAAIVSQNISYLAPAPRRIVFCVLVSGNRPQGSDIPPVTSYVPYIAGELDRPSNEFTYNGRDIASLCTDNPPPDALRGIPQPQYHYITWQPSPADILPDILEDVYTEALASAWFFDFFELTVLGNHQHCGDGYRQAGELCDTGIHNIIDPSSGCNHTCTPYRGYECNSLPLETSVCRLTSCGDGMRTSDEQCDDGNSQSGDGCSECAVEDGYVCDNHYNVTTNCTVTPVTVATTTPTMAPSSPTHRISTTRSPTTTDGSEITGGMFPTHCHGYPMFLLLLAVALCVCAVTLL